MSKKDLVRVILDNPGCVAEIDNDWWGLFTMDPADYDGEAEDIMIADSSDDFDPPLGDGGYGSGHCYGGDLLQALAVIAGIKVRSV